MDVESLSAGILTGKDETTTQQGMNFVPDIIAWQIPLSFVIALFVTSNMAGYLTPLVLLFYYCFVWIVVSAIIITADLVLVLLGFAVCGVTHRLVS